MTTGINGVNRRILAAGHPEVTLVKGEGYFYYVFDNLITKPDGVGRPTITGYTCGDEMIYQTDSVPCYAFRDLMFDQWVKDGIAFAVHIKKENGCDP